MQRSVLALRIVLPAVWMGLLIGLSFLEAPLKFQAPGITIPLGLGIGRLVFFALEIASVALLIALTAMAFARPRLTRSGCLVLIATWIVLAVQAIAIRPPLNARSDIIIAGGDPGPSVLHYAYIATDLVLLGLLLAMIVVAVRQALPASVNATGVVGERDLAPTR